MVSNMFCAAFDLEDDPRGIRLALDPLLPRRDFPYLLLELAVDEAIDGGGRGAAIEGADT